MYLTRDPLSILKGKVLHDMFTENSIERLVGKRQWAPKVEQVVNVSIAKSISIHPVRIIEATRARAQVQKQRALQLGKCAVNSRLLSCKCIPYPKAEKVDFPTRDR